METFPFPSQTQFCFVFNSWVFLFDFKKYGNYNTKKIKNHNFVQKHIATSDYKEGIVCVLIVTQKKHTGHKDSSTDLLKTASLKKKKAQI